MQHYLLLTQMVKSVNHSYLKGLKKGFADVSICMKVCQEMFWFSVLNIFGHPIWKMDKNEKSLALPLFISVYVSNVDVHICVGLIIFFSRVVVWEHTFLSRCVATYCRREHFCSLNSIFCGSWFRSWLSCSILDILRLILQMQ